MRAFDRSQLIIEIRQRFAARCGSRNRDDSPARSVLTQPSYVDLARHHLLRRSDIDMAQRRRRDRLVCWCTPAFCWTFDRHWRLSADDHGRAYPGRDASASRSSSSVLSRHLAAMDSGERRISGTELNRSANDNTSRSAAPSSSTAANTDTVRAVGSALNT
jgi:hypothetical protein